MFSYTGADSNNPLALFPSHDCGAVVIHSTSKESVLNYAWVCVFVSRVLTSTSPVLFVLSMLTASQWHCRTLNSAILGWRCHILYVSPPSLTSFSESKKRKKPSLMTSLHQLPVSLSTTESFPTDFMVTPCIKQCWNLFITNWCT